MYVVVRASATVTPMCEYIALKFSNRRRLLGANLHCKLDKIVAIHFTYPISILHTCISVRNLYNVPQMYGTSILLL